MSDKRLRNIQAALVGCSTNDTYSDDVKNLFQDKVDANFEYASDYYIVQKEDVNGVYQNIGLRVAPSYSLTQGSTIKDDFKTVIHKRYDTQLYLGERYQFDGYTWITIDTGRSKASSTSCQVQRCGDFLRFYDDNGIYHEIPAIIGKSGVYDLNSDTILMLPDNQLKVLVKYDSESNLIKWADQSSPDSKYTRFLLHGQAWRVTSIDKSSFIRNNVGYVDIRLQADQIKTGSDDLVNNIADAFSNNVSVDILNGDSTVTIGQTLQLNSLVTKNAVEVPNPTIVYTSATPTVASVNSSGLVSALLMGASSITATYGTVSDSVLISATPVVSNNYTIDFSSNTGIIDSIKVGQSVSYDIVFKNNGTSYVDSATFSLTDDTGLAPTSMVSILSQTGTSCTIKASSVSANVGQYVRLYAVGTNKTEYIRLLIKSLFG